MFSWFIYSLILKHPTTSICLFAIIVIGVFSVMIGWPAYLFLAISIILLTVFSVINNKGKMQNIAKSSSLDIDGIEKKNRWIMGLLAFFALLGNITSFFVTLFSLEHDSGSLTSLSAMAVFQFILIGIPYLLMNLVKIKSSFWFGLMSSVILFAAIQFFVLFLLLESKDTILASHTSWNYEFIKGQWLIAMPLSVVPIMLFADSLGKAFGFALKDENGTYGYDKEKHKFSIVKDNKLSLLGMMVSFVWSLLLSYYSYYYMITLWGEK